MARPGRRQIRTGVLKSSWSQNAPKITILRLSWPQAGQKGPKIAPRLGKLDQDGPRLLQIYFNKAQETSKMAPRCPKIGLRWPQHGQRWSKMSVSGCLRFSSWAFPDAPWLCLVLPSLCFRFAFALPSLCLCFAFALHVFCLCFALPSLLFCFAFTLPWLFLCFPNGGDHRNYKAVI